MEQRSNKERLILPALLLLAFIARLAMVFVLRGDPLTFDSKVYLGMADALLNESPEASFPNGYPLLIAIFKVALPTKLEIPALLMLNVLVGTATVGLVYTIARWLTTRPAALAVGLIMAIYPHQIHYTRLIMTETLCTFLLSLAFFLIFYPTYRHQKPTEKANDNKNSVDEDALIAFFFAGTILHYSTMVRPSVSLVFPLLLLAGFVARQPKKLLALLTAGYLLSAGLFFGLEKLGFIKAPSATANNMLISINSDSRYVDFRTYTDEEQAQATKTYLEFARTQPGQFFTQRIISLWELWGVWSLPGDKAENATLPVRFVVFVRFFLLLTSLVAVWRYRKEFATWVLFAPAISITILHIASFSNHRFIVPAEPFLFVLSGRLIAEMQARRKTEVKANPTESNP